MPPTDFGTLFILKTSNQFGLDPGRALTYRFAIQTSLTVFLLTFVKVLNFIDVLGI